MIRAPLNHPNPARAQLCRGSGLSDNSQDKFKFIYLHLLRRLHEASQPASHPTPTHVSIHA